MSARYTIQDMQRWASHQGGKCLSKEYWGLSEKLTWMCAKGHTWDSIPFVTTQGNWCPACTGKRKSTIEEMQAIAMERRGKCLSKIYTNTHGKIKWQCVKGHIWKNAPHAIKSGSWCPYCCGNVKHTIIEMKQIAKTRGGKCLSKKYVNRKTKLKWKCAEGHIWQAISGSIIQQKSWCPVCVRKNKLHKGKRYTIEEMHRIAKKRKGKCLSKKYKNINVPLKWQCAREHIWNARPYNVLNLGSWCAKCWYMDKRTKYKYYQN